MANKPPAADPKLDKYIGSAADGFPIAGREVKQALDLITKALLTFEWVQITAS